MYLQYYEPDDNNVVVLSTAILCMFVYCQVMAYIQHLSDGNAVPAALQDHSRSDIKHNNQFIKLHFRCTCTTKTRHKDNNNRTIVLRPFFYVNPDEPVPEKRFVSCRLLIAAGWLMKLSCSCFSLYDCHLVYNSHRWQREKLHQNFTLDALPAATLHGSITAKVRHSKRPP